MTIKMMMMTMKMMIIMMMINLPTDTTPLLRLPRPVSVERGKCFTFACLNLSILRCLDASMFGCQDASMFVCLDVWKSQCLDVWMSESLNVWLSRCLIVWLFGFHESVSSYLFTKKMFTESLTEMTEQRRSDSCSNQSQ